MKKQNLIACTALVSVLVFFNACTNASEKNQSPQTVNQPQTVKPIVKDTTALPAATTKPEEKGEKEDNDKDDKK